MITRRFGRRGPSVSTAGRPSVLVDGVLPDKPQNREEPERDYAHGRRGRAA